MAQVKKVPKDGYLFLQGDDADAMYIVKSGAIGLFVADYMVEKMVTEAPPGFLFGEMSLFDGHPRSASAKALIESEVVVLPYEKLRNDMSQMPEWVMVTLKTLTDKIREANTLYLNSGARKKKGHG